MAVWPIYPFLCKTTSWMWNHFNIVIWTLVPAFSGNLGSNNIEFTVFDIDLTLYNVTRSKRSFFFGARTINPNGEVRFSTEWWMNFTMTIPKELTTMKNEPNVDKWEPFKTKNHIALHRTRITHLAGEYSSIEPSMLWSQTASTVFDRNLNKFWNLYWICIWISATNKTCRRCGEGVGNASHITNNCKLGLVLSTKRHNAILHSLADLLKKNRMEVTLDKKFHESTLRPGLVTKARGITYIIDVVVATTTPRLIWRKPTRENEISMIA